ncbi:MAG: hypothetical protein Ta2D_13470 [Rickettsiales bacterium]|nr:MAG: hypothetical protein Ta2D_13470 [Rickettsiales bacterium]
MKKYAFLLICGFVIIGLVSALFVKQYFTTNIIKEDVFLW